MRGTARPTTLDNTVTAGEQMRRVVRTSQQVVQRPVDSSRRRRAAVARGGPVEAPPGDRGPAVAIDVPDTRRAGLYRLAWDEGPLGTQQDLYAANPDPRESALERIGEHRAENDAGSRCRSRSPRRAATAPTCSRRPAAKSGTTWRAGLLVLLIVESIFATWVGRSR